MRFGKLKDELANNFLLGTDQYPDTFKKVMHIMGNYHMTKGSRSFRGDGTESGLAFIQRGGEGRGQEGRGSTTGQGAPTREGADGSGRERKLCHNRC